MIEDSYAEQRQKAVCAHFTSKEILHFAFAEDGLQAHHCFWINIIIYNQQAAHYRSPSQKARDIEPMLVKCWATVCDAGRTLKLHWVNVSCLLGRGRSPS